MPTRSLFRLVETDPPTREQFMSEGARIERQGRRAGHHNVYASADDLLRWVVRVVPVR